jgi:hypothetical protein
MEILGDNILDPLAFEDGKIDIFIRDHDCACGSHLIKRPTSGRKWHAYCPACDLSIIATGFVHKSQTEKAAANVLEGKLILHEPVTKQERDVARALKELGF